ncbi:MAG: hypothetical protein JXB49_19830 [Bacteroidales bacterium]|nr:hypothetical protein [Bacteroidales bacterium]
MKTIYSFLLIFVFVFSVNAQQTERELTKEIKDKAVKEARKEAKQFEKDGWDVAPGSIPLAKVVENSWMKQYQTDEKGNPVYITADGNGVAQSQSVAEMQAIELAKLQLAGLVQTNITSIVEANIGNAQLAPDDAASVTEVVQASKNLITTELGYINPYFKIYRKINNNVECQVRLFYDVKQSLEIAKKVVKKELKEKLEMNQEKIDQIMGLE